MMSSDKKPSRNELKDKSLKANPVEADHQVEKSKHQKDSDLCLTQCKQ